MSTIHFTSDTHFGHTNIVIGVTNWPEEVRERSCRNFQSIEEMDELLLDRINTRVKPGDTLYHLGDWSFGDFENILKYRKRIHCRNVHLILGNHDHHIERNRAGIRGAFSSVTPYLEISFNKHHIIMSHYPFQTWNRGHYGSWMLHGHCHGNLPADAMNRKIYDVGVDTHWDFAPYSFDEMVEIMKDRGLDKHD
jgi:calcineurin-like phosphoesterase family protein